MLINIIALILCLSVAMLAKGDEPEMKLLRYVNYFMAGMNFTCIII
jgi:hypothetical protein